MGIDLELIVSIISDALRALFGFLCEIIYTGIASLYDLFIRLGSFTYVDEFSVIYNKISLIIGIFMVFRVTFWLLEALINPDTITDKEKNPTKIVQKVLVSVVLLAITPSIFEYAFKLQDAILNSNIIENIISIDEVNDTTTSGRLLSAELFTSFYTPTETDDGIIESDCSDMFAGKSGSYYENLREYGKLENLNNYCLTERVDEKDRYSPYVINFNGLFATAVGIFVFWMILMYCISLGTRYVQLVYLQIIAPIPIMCNLAPGKDNMFSKWVKQCTTTYLDLFIRIIIINFVMVLSSMVINTDIITNIGGDNPWIKIFLILGLLTFAKKAPDLIQELLPKSVTKASGDFGLSWKKRTDSMIGGKFIYDKLNAKRAIGYTAGGLVGSTVGGVLGAAGGKGVGSRIMGGLSGAAKGFSTGSKKGNIFKNISEVKKNQASQNSRLQQWRIAAGKSEDEPNTISDWASRRRAATNKAFGFELPADYFERGKKAAKDAVDAYQSSKKNSIAKAIEKGTKAKAFNYGNTTLTELDQRKRTAEQAVTENNKASLLSTADGNKKLEAFLTGTAGTVWKTSSGIPLTVNFSALSDAQKDSLADAFIRTLQTESNDATSAYNDAEKQFGFVFQIEQAFGIQRDKTTNTILKDATGALQKGAVSEEYINYFEAMNSFVEQYDEDFGITTGPNPLFANGTKKFDINKMAKLMSEAEDGNATSQSELEGIFKDYDMLKALMSRVATVESQPKISRDKADKGYAGK